MKVICIDDKWEFPSGEERFQKPQIGDICEPTGVYHEEGTTWYSLKEFIGYFETIAFSPLSDIDETKLVNKKQDVCV